MWCSISSNAGVTLHLCGEDGAEPEAKLSKCLTYGHKLWMTTKRMRALIQVISNCNLKLHYILVITVMHCEVSMLGVGLFAALHCSYASLKIEINMFMKLCRSGCHGNYRSHSHPANLNNASVKQVDLI